MRARSCCASRDARADRDVQRDDEAVGRDREEEARLADASEVDIAIRAIAPSESQTRYGASDETADVMAKIPLATETATVRT